MANNTIGWGQGATNNNIGWGRGSTNDIGWGSIYENSYVGDTDIQGADARFIITVKTDNAGTSLSNQFTLPWIGTYDVEWGDGNSDVGVSGTQTHTYASAGTYDVAVTADPASLNKQIYFFNTGDKEKLIDIKNWGTVQWTSTAQAFNGCSNLIITASDYPDLSLCTETNTMFRLCSSLTMLDVSQWDTSSATLMYNMFFSCTSLKVDLSGLDIALVTNLSNFATNTQINEVDGGGNQITTNYDNTLISWAAQTPQNNIVINFGTAKYSWRAIEARNTLVNDYNWTITDGGIADDDEFVITVRTTTSAETFTIPTTGGGYNYNVNWGDGTSTVGETGNATHEYATAGDYDIQITGTFPRIIFFSSTERAKLIDLKNWGNGAWTSMEGAFYGCSNLYISAVDVPNLTSVNSMFVMFFNNASLTTLDVSEWDTSSVTNMTSMLQSCTSFNADLSGLDIQSVTNFTNFALNVTLSTANYDATLIAWEANLQATYPAGSGYTASININFGGSQYTLGSAAETARTSLRNTFGWTITDGGGVSGVLNQYTGAAAAYSLRNLSTATTSVVRVRADVVGQPEQDFTYDEIMDGTLATFVGAGNNGYVVTWYDQSGNGNHATQGTASAQPQIVASGVVITENGMPAVQFDGVNDYFTTSSISVKSSFIVATNLNLVNAGNYIIGGTNQGLYWGGAFAGVNGIAVYESGATTLDSLIEDTSQHLASIFMDASTDEIFVDGVSKDTGTSAGVTISAIGRRPDIGAATSHRGSIQEIIIYNSDKLSDNGNINGNINGYYSIY